MKKTANPWSVPVAVEDIPDSGLHVAIDAPATARAEVAELAGLRDLPQLSAVFDLTRQGAGVHVSGQVSARVGQTCVVTLEPIESAVEEAVDLKFAAASGTEAEPKSARKRPRDGDEPPEPLFNGRFDLGALATEFLILGHRSLSAQSGRRIRAAEARGYGRTPLCRAGIAEKEPRRRPIVTELQAVDRGQNRLVWRGPAVMVALVRHTPLTELPAPVPAPPRSIHARQGSHRA